MTTGDPHELLPWLPNAKAKLNETEEQRINTLPMWRKSVYA